MYSLNAPVPSTVATLATDLAADLVGAQARTRGSHTLVVKRLGDDDAGYARLAARTRDVLGGTPACEARVAGIEVFERVPSGTAPVVYLRVESPGLTTLHERLCDAFDPVDGIEGEDYVPHVTVARGGSVEAARSLAERDVDAIEWVVDELVFWDSTREGSAGRVSLPA